MTELHEYSASDLVNELINRVDCLVMCYVYADDKPSDSYETVYKGGWQEIFGAIKMMEIEAGRSFRKYHDGLDDEEEENEYSRD